MNDIAGTLYFIAPEVLAGKPYDYSADIYSLGVVMYWLCSGTLPFVCKLDSDTIE